MARRALPALLLATAAVADAGSAPGLAFYAVLVAIPVVATVALSSFGELLDAESSARPERLVQGLVWALLLVLLVFGASVRAPDVAEGVVPMAAVSMLVAGLVALALEAALDLVATAREARPETHALARGLPAEPLEGNRRGGVLRQVD